MNVDRYRKLGAVARDPNAAPGERETASRVRARMEAKHPTIRAAAEAAEAQERQERTAQASQDDVPGPFTTGHYGPGPDPTRPAGTPRPSGRADLPPWMQALGSFVASTAHHVGTSLSVASLVKGTVRVQLRENSRSINLHVRIPHTTVDRVATYGAAGLVEMGRVVGVLVSGALHEHLSDD